MFAIYLVPKPNVIAIKRLFGGFCIFLGTLVGYASSQGGISRAILPVLRDISSTPMFQVSNNEKSLSGVSRIFHFHSQSSSNVNKWIVISFISFLAGLILVPNIGVGPALTTYVLLELYGYEAEQAIVTGIITGGWVCILPFIIHWVDIGDVPWKMWIMVLPGVFIGSKVSLETLSETPFYKIK